MEEQLSDQEDFHLVPDVKPPTMEDYLSDQEYQFIQDDQPDPENVMANHSSASTCTEDLNAAFKQSTADPANAFVDLSRDMQQFAPYPSQDFAPASNALDGTMNAIAQLGYLVERLSNCLQDVTTLSDQLKKQRDGVDRRRFDEANNLLIHKQNISPYFAPPGLPRATSVPPGFSMFPPPAPLSNPYQSSVSGATATASLMDLERARQGGLPSPEFQISLSMKQPKEQQASEYSTLQGYPSPYDPLASLYPLNK
ncbi:hypothetical protein ACJZ2D_008540 [Fusarium nematophilum]